MAVRSSNENPMVRDIDDFPDVKDGREPDLPSPEGWAVPTYSQDDF